MRTGIVRSSRILSRAADDNWSIADAIMIGGGGAIAFLISSLFLVMLASRNPFFYGLRRGDLVALETIIGCLFVSAVGYLILRATRKIHHYSNFWKSIGWKSNTKSSVSCLIGGIGLSALLRYLLVGNLAVDSIRYVPKGTSLLLTTVSLLLLQPFIEEVYFRGILFEALAFKIGRFLGAIIVTLIFVLLHVQHRGGVVPVSLVLGVVRLTTRSSSNCLILHSSYNLGVVLWGL